MAENYSLNCVTSCARVRNCYYMYLEKRAFVGISTLLQALCLGGGRGRGGRWEVIMNGCFQWDPVNV